MEALPISDGSGYLDRYADFASQFAGHRTVDVWCPPGYDDDGNARYPVLYMHDGQNIFDPALAYGGVDWGIDEAVTRLMREAGHPGVIVVGVWNSAQRWQDFMPQKSLESTAGQAILPHFVEAAGGMPVSNHYLAFLVNEVKPLIDASYRTRSGRVDTLVMGSSMGGLVSLYAVEEYPHIFGGAGCLSTHWPAGGDPLVDYLAEHLPPPGAHRLYFDYGTENLDAQYEPFQQRMDERLQAAGFQRGVDWLTLKFEGADHNERSWRERVDIPLRFLLGAS
ncbi:MAG: alpha/beta hydrolase-fold protein [Caldilineales bacterium]